MIVQWICHAVNKCTFALFSVCLFSFDLFVFNFILIYLYLIWFIFFISMWWVLLESIMGKQQSNGACSLQKWNLWNINLVSEA